MLYVSHNDRCMVSYRRDGVVDGIEPGADRSGSGIDALDSVSRSPKPMSFSHNSNSFSVFTELAVLFTNFYN